MGAFGIGRVMKEGDDPGGSRALKIIPEPRCHRAIFVDPRRARIIDGAIRRHRVERDEMDIAVIERVVMLGSRGYAAGLASGWERVYVEVGIGVHEGGRLSRLMVTETR